jgi:hypothetical protein
MEYLEAARKEGAREHIVEHLDSIEVLPCD